MIKLNSTIVKLAIEEAKQSTHPLFKLGCVIFKKKIIISTGRNYNLKSRKSLHPKFTRWKNSVHAEVDAIINAKTDLKNCCLFVVRINKKNNFLLAKPCQQCQQYIKHVGIKKIYYSINQYPYITELNLKGGNIGT